MIVLLAFITSFYIREPGVNEILSFIASFASISLAGVAIYISVKEATKIDTVKSEIHTLVGELNEKVGQIDQKINRFDIVATQKSLESSQIEEFVDIISKQINVSKTGGNEENV